MLDFSFDLTDVYYYTDSHLHGINYAKVKMNDRTNETTSHYGVFVFSFDRRIKYMIINNAKKFHSTQMYNLCNRRLSD